jgi:nickel-type superoxide dismutase maturation protease
MMWTMPIRIFKVADRSMEPALKSGDYVFATAWFSKLKVGDIVILKHPARPIKIVKRISAISDKSAYVIGDNKSESEDSRSFGSVPRESILGRVLLTV